MLIKNKYIKFFGRIHSKRQALARIARSPIINLRDSSKFSYRGSAPPSSSPPRNFLSDTYLGF